MLPNVLESKYDAKTFQNLVYYFYALTSAHKSSYVSYHRRLAQLGPLKLYCFSAVYYQISLERYQTICARSFSFAKCQQAFESLYKPVSIQ